MEEIIILQQEIVKYLNEFYDSLELQNSAGEQILNKAAENVFRNILNLVYNLDLVNANLELSNYPAVDLIDIENEVCYQVTYTDKIEKIKDTLRKFFANKLHQKFNSINFLILKSARNYNRTTFKKNYEKILLDYGIPNYYFELKTNIIDSSRLLKLILNLSDSKQLIKIKELLLEYKTGRIKFQLSDYHEQLKNEFYEVVMDDPSGMTLSDIYVAPNFEYFASQIHAELTKPQNHHHFVDINITAENIVTSYVRNDVENLKKIFLRPQSRVLFVLGFPGQGKTSFCKKLIYDHLKDNIDIPIFYLKLRNVRNTKGLIDSPLKIIHDELEVEVDQEIPKSVLKKSIIILDGLDELYMKDNLKADDIEKFGKELIRDCERLKYYKVIVTSRYGYIDLQKIYEPQFLALSLQMFSQEKQIEWLNKYEVFHQNVLLDETKIRLFNKEHRFHYIKELITQPLLLYIVASLNIELDSGTDRAKIYDLLFDQIIERKYSKDGQIDLLKNLSKDDLRALLREIAFLIFVSGNEYVTEEQLLSEFVIREYTAKLSKDNLSQSLKGVLVSFYFKESKRRDAQNKSTTAVEFLHKSLQEFLAAEKIVESLFKDLLDKNSAQKYFLRQESEILEWLNKLFIKQQLTYEILGYMSSMIAKKNLSLRIELGNRLTEHLPYFVEKDFVLKYDIHEKNVLEKAIVMFISYWQLLMSLKLNQNFLTSSFLKDTVSRYLNIISTGNWSHAGIDVSYQTFENCTIQFLSVIETNIVNTSFSDVTFYRDSFMMEKLQSVSFINCSISTMEFFEVDIYDCKFINVDINDLTIGNVSFIDVNFKDCKISGLRIEKQKGIKTKNLVFTNVTFFKDTYDKFRLHYPKAKYKKCFLGEHGSDGKTTLITID